MTIEFDSEGLKIIDDGRTAVVAWDSVDSVFVYKEDLVIVDRIVTLFKLDGDREFSIDEEMEGWKALVDALPMYLPNCRDFADWFMEVAFPAFEPKPALIFKRLRPDQVN
ncbi:MAG: hypothetical protein KF831_10510 [Acidobacteria bacterium]|nr:hypothetical protein [Acidobacteriota bacterium]